MHPTHADLIPDLLLQFLSKGDPRLERWNVGIVEARHGPRCPEPLGAAGVVRAVRRAKIADSTSVADIKALMSKRDVLFDCGDGLVDRVGWDELKATRMETVGEVPLLLLYPIDRTSRPQRRSRVRAPLEAAFDVLGYGIVFPGSVREGGDSVSVELSPLSADEIGAIESEEAAQAEAAGVERKIG